MSKAENNLTRSKQIWFPAKKFGWGWGQPKVWQGWVALVSCLTVGLAPLVYFTTVYKGDTYCKSLLDQKIVVTCNPDGMLGLYIAASIMWLTAAVFVLIIISNIKGEKPSWRWGKKGPLSEHAEKS